jgi:E3 ubiquitin-protein ligase MUL1
MLGVVGMTALGIAVAHVWQRRRLRLHLERVRSELRASESGGSDSDDAEGEASVEPPSGTECALCLSRVKDTVLVPCGHMACCHRCAGRLTTCPLCRAVVRRMLRVDVLPLKPAAGVDAAATTQQ